MTEREKRYTPADALIRFGRICAGESVAAIDGRNVKNDEEANAHLIAAAPELLEALEDLCNDYAEWEADPIRGGCSNIHDLYAKARAAIAKAHGEAP